MTVGYSNIRRWNSSGVDQAGKCIMASVRQLNRAADTMSDQTFPSGWIGRGATAAAVTRNRLTHWLQIQGRIRDEFARKVYAADTEVIAISRAIVELEDWARSEEFLIADDGSISDEHDYGGLSFDDVPTYFRRRGLLADLVAKRDSILAHAAEVDAALAAAAGTAMKNLDPADEIALPSQEIQDTWEGMTDEERETVILNMAAELAKRYGVSEYSVRFAVIPTGAYGQHDPTTHEITINADFLNDPVVINTIVHEMMHAGHDADLTNFPGLSASEIEELRDNEGNYLPSSSGWENYRYQPEEHTTRQEADQVVKSLTPEQFEGYR